MEARNAIEEAQQLSDDELDTVSGGKDAPFGHHVIEHREHAT